MSSLRKRLTDPRTYLIALCLVTGLAVADALRLPDRQITAWCYIKSVRAYQTVADPLLRGYVRCRYRPTCSRYSVEAVRKYGTAKGLILTASRLWRCRAEVPIGTEDLVP